MLQSGRVTVPRSRNFSDCYRRPRNLQVLLVLPSTELGRKARVPQPDGTFPSDRPRCKTRERVHSIATLPYGADRSISIRRHHSSQSASVVYLISCTQAQCDAVYSRETGCTLRERMKGHRSSIKNNEDTPVAVHFTHQDHSWRVTFRRGANWHRAASTPRKAVDQQAEGVPAVHCAEPRIWLCHPSAVNLNVILSVSILPVWILTLFVFPVPMCQFDIFISSTSPPSSFTVPGTGAPMLWYRYVTLPHPTPLVRMHQSDPFISSTSPLTRFTVPDTGAPLSCYLGTVCTPFLPILISVLLRKPARAKRPVCIK